ncbi:MAG: cyclic-di-AMP receptor [Lactobacillaceae bacterium]|jgi:uncharacterized protein YaaQ|nr:cyclic-di-AMP receptor [Lactobacillaceae bacterium]
MKLITAIVQDKDANNVANALIENDIRATRISSVGGFLRSGNVTFMIAIDEGKVDDVIELISQHSKKRQEFMSGNASLLTLNPELIEPIEVTVGGATIIVQNIERFKQI